MGGQHTSHSAAAARRLRTLHDEHLTPPTRPSGSTRHPTPVHAPTPIDLGVLDYIESATHEIVAHTHTAVPTAGPAPQGLEAVYAWAEEATAHLDAEHQQIRDVLLVRQSLEHALRAGNDTVIRQQPCPTCGCWGLFWSPASQAAACANKRCTTKTGQVSRWTLQQLAEHHVARTAAAALRTAT